MSKIGGLSSAEVKRYSRQIVMPEVGPEGQLKLKASSALVVGAGGLGIPTSIYLAAAGVGRIGLVDHDGVETSNLHRQTLYYDADVGRPKVQVASERLTLVNPHVSVVSHELRLDSSNAMTLLSGYDVVVDCTDNFPSRYLISDACVFLHKPDVYASVFRFEGQASVFCTEQGPCYRCLFPEPPPPDSVQDCAEAGVLGVLPGMMGSIQAAQAINLLLGNAQSLAGRLLLFNAGDMTFTELKVKKNHHCPVCGDNPRIRELVDYEEFCGMRKPVELGDEVNPAMLKQWLDDGKKVVLVDVREPFEYSICRLKGSKLIPMGELTKRVGELDKADETVVYCHTGRRSAIAVQFLASQGFSKARNLNGGIKAWAEQVDRTMPMY